MRFSEEQATWLRAALDGKQIQWRNRANGPDAWFTAKDFKNDAVILTQPEHYEIRIKPDVIVVNGIEVPAPVKIAPPLQAEFWIADPSDESGASGPFYWNGGEEEEDWLHWGLIHALRETAAAHGKAMLAHKPG